MDYLQSAGGRLLKFPFEFLLLKLKLDSAGLRSKLEDFSSTSFAGNTKLAAKNLIYNIGRLNMSFKKTISAPIRR